MRRDQHLQVVRARHDQHPDFEDEVVARLTRGIKCERYAVVIRDLDRDAEGSYGTTSTRRSNGSWITSPEADREWEPIAIYDLDTGRSLPYSVHIHAELSDDPAARIENDLDKREGVLA